MLYSYCLYAYEPEALFFNIAGQLDLFHTLEIFIAGLYNKDNLSKANPILVLCFINTPR